MKFERFESSNKDSDENHNVHEDDQTSSLFFDPEFIKVPKIPIKMK